MEFKVRISNIFLLNMFLVVFALAMGTRYLISQQIAHGFWHYMYIGWFLIAAVRLIAYRKYLYKMLVGKPILAVNEVYINDLLNNIKYNWNDIKEVFEDEGYLYIILYKPEDYVEHINNPRKRSRAKNIINSGNETPFRINIDMVDSDPNALLQLLDDYSTQTATVKTKNRNGRRT